MNTVTAAMASLSSGPWSGAAGWVQTWRSHGLAFRDGPGGDTQCDPVRIEHGPGMSWTAYKGGRVIAKQASCISPTPWPKDAP